MARKQVPVEALRFGMYVAALDRPWTETPFTFQGFYLRTDEELAQLKKCCKHVFVDVERTAVADKPRPPAPQFKIRGSTAYPEKASVELEFRHASSAYAQSAASVAELLSPLGKPGGVLEAKA